MAISIYSSKNGNYAIKTYEEKSSELFPTSNCVREIIYLNYLKHENIINLEDVLYSTDRYKIKLFMPAMKYDLKTNRNIKEDTLKIIFHKCLQGLKYLHDLNLVHRDIKPENILSNEDFTDIKICDFGSIKSVPSIHDVKDLNNEGTTLMYVAPELIFTNYKYVYDTSVDVWALICTMWEILFQEVLFDAYSHVGLVTAFFKILGIPDLGRYPNLDSMYINAHLKIKVVPDNSVENKKSKLSSELKEIFSSVLTYEINQRPNCDNILSHKYFSNIKDDCETEDEMSDTNSNILKSPKDSADVACCYWLACMAEELAVDARTVLSTISLYDNINKELGINCKKKQGYIISCLSICMNLYSYDAISIDIYREAANNSIDRDTINRYRIQILQILEPEWIFNVKELNDGDFANYILLSIMGKLEVPCDVKNNEGYYKELLDQLMKFIKFHKVDDLKLPYGIDQLI